MAAAIGVATGSVFLLIYSRFAAATLALNAYLVLAIMLAIYLGAHLVTGDLAKVISETVIATVWLGLGQLALLKWKPGIGLLILAHGGYDFLFGAATGVAAWYPPLCVGFDVVVGIGLVVILARKERAASG